MWTSFVNGQQGVLAKKNSMKGEVMLSVTMAAVCHLTRKALNQGDGARNGKEVIDLRNITKEKSTKFIDVQGKMRERKE